jgi:3-methyladenine DNA glycosylase AlkC
MELYDYFSILRISHNQFTAIPILEEIANSDDLYIRWNVRNNSNCSPELKEAIDSLTLIYYWSQDNYV